MEMMRHTKVARALTTKLMFTGLLVGLLALLAIGCSSSNTTTDSDVIDLAPVASLDESVIDIDGIGSLLHDEANDHAEQAIAYIDDVNGDAHDESAALHSDVDDHGDSDAMASMDNMDDDHEDVAGEGILDIAINVIEGRAWGFDPEVISVPVGMTVRLTLINDGKAEHDFEVAANMAEEFELVLGADSPMAESGHHNADSISAHTLPGTSATVTFTALHVGEYEFICTLPGHKEAGMIGKLIVIPELEATNLEADGPTS